MDLQTAFNDITTAINDYHTVLSDIVSTGSIIAAIRKFLQNRRNKTATPVEQRVPVAAAPPQARGGYAPSAPLPAPGYPAYQYGAPVRSFGVAPGATFTWLDAVRATLLGIPAVFILAEGDIFYRNETGGDRVITWLLAFLGIMALLSLAGLFPAARSNKIASSIAAGLFFIIPLSIGSTIYAVSSGQDGHFPWVGLLIAYVITYSILMLCIMPIFGAIGKALYKR